ncbi:hypothetical protein [Phenylobacterium sp.]|uniref:hypothetical protein n=1 Tax=Phenylobacterium sp. TaxID=1871053 RepID=UPI002737FBC7|nr:hypothetical protein [Phenylobacterium sp.]MDP3869941.1 hypothetical protein [Phenylobacterium sp.]
MTNHIRDMLDDRTTSWAALDRESRTALRMLAARYEEADAAALFWRDVANGRKPKPRPFADIFNGAGFAHPLTSPPIVYVPPTALASV